MKYLFSKIKTFFGKIRWVLRRKYNQFKSIIVSYIGLAYAVLTKKDLRLAKKRAKRDSVKDYLEFDDYSLDIRFDVDIDSVHANLNNEYQETKNRNWVDVLNEEELELLVLEEQRLENIYQQRLALTHALERELRHLEFERDKRIRKISGERSVYDDEVELIRTEVSAASEELRQAYNIASLEILKNNPPMTGGSTDLKEALYAVRIKRAKQSLPESRKRREQKDKARQISKDLLQALLYLTPVLIFLITFTFYPILNAFRLVVYQNYNDRTGVYSGFSLFGNFIKVINEAGFIRPSAHVKSSAMINTLLIVGITVPVSIIISLLIAVLLNSIKFLTNALQTVFFLPYVTNSIAVGLVFAYMFQNNGLFNKFLAWFNINGGRWVQFGAPFWKAMFVLMLFSIWNGLAFKIMVFLSAIQGIDEQYYQAAAIDATPRFKQFTRITAPLISPTILYIVITSIIGAFKTYSSVIAIFGNRGRPPGVDYHLKTIVFYIYDYFDVSGKMPEAAAASIVLFGIILVMTVVQMQVSKKRVHY